MTKTIPQSCKSASRKWDFCWDTSTPEGRRDVSAFLMADARRIKRVAPDEARNRMASARALRELTGTIIPTARLLRRIRRMPRARARRTAPATAARAADSGGKDPDPEPPRPRSLRSLYSLPASVVGGAL